MDIIKYKSGRALFIDSEDLIDMDARFGSGTSYGLAIRTIVEHREAFGINAIIVVTSMGFMSLPKFLREALAENGANIAPITDANCFRNEWWNE